MINYADEFKFTIKTVGYIYIELEGICGRTYIYGMLTYIMYIIWYDVYAYIFVIKIRMAKSVYTKNALSIELN